MNEQLLSRIRQCPTLPSLPTIAMDVLELAQREEVDISEIARTISKDPALSGKILRTVNSSFYGRIQSISQVSQALVILGLQSVKTLVLGFSLVSNLQQNKATGFKHLDYWKRSIYAATAAKTLAAKSNMVQIEECFLAALLQDLGMLVLDQVLKEEYGPIHEKATMHRELAALEHLTLGMTHAEVSGFLAETWKLPPVLCVPMRYHHDPKAVTDPALRKLTDVGFVAGLSERNWDLHNARSRLRSRRAECFQLGREQIQLPSGIGVINMDGLVEQLHLLGRRPASRFDRPQSVGDLARIRRNHRRLDCLGDR